MKSVKEYESLRAELLNLGLRQFNLLSLSLTATGIILGFAAQINNQISWAISLFPLLLLVSAGEQFVRHAYATMRIATYIRCFIEYDNADFRWETFMSAVRKSDSVRNALGYPTSWPTYELVVTTAGLVCLLISAIICHDGNTTSEWSSMAVLILTIGWLVYSLGFWLRMRSAVFGYQETDCKTLRKEFQSYLDAIQV